MEKLADILRAAGVDVSTLDMIFQADMEAIHRLTMPGTRAVEAWQTLRGLVPQTGCWPVLLGDDDNLLNLKDNLKRLRYPRAVRILEEAATINPVQWFENRRLDEIDQLQRFMEEQEDPARRARYGALLADQGPLRGMPQGPWPDDGEPRREFDIPLDPIRHEPRPQIHIGLVSTALGWQVPAYLRYGAWNACPSAAEHVALLHYWGDRYGAEVVGMAGGVVEMKVARPPAGRDAALELAVQQYLYCQNLVAQGAETLQQLAASLLGGTAWFFWWD